MEQVGGIVAGCGDKVGEMITCTRVLNSEIWMDEEFSRLTVTQRLMFLVLISVVDDDGTISDDPDNLRSKIFPYDDISDWEITINLNRLEAQGFITRLDCRIAVNNWDDFSYFFDWHRASKWSHLKKTIFKRDNHTCVYCGETAQEADHVYPKSKGGPDEAYNVVAACTNCNRSKRERLLNDWYPLQPFFSPDRLSYISKIIENE